jgi:hypothetical protein
MLLYSPDWLFLYPGISVVTAGVLVSAWLLQGPREFFGAVLDIHTLLIACVGVLIGYQTIAFAFFSKVFAMTEGLVPERKEFMRLFRFFSLETGLIAGFLMMVAGAGGVVYSFMIWEDQSFGALDTPQTMRRVIPSVTFLALGVQTILASFFLSILGLKRS